MKLTKKLISFLHRVFDKDPVPFLALRLGCDGTGLTWGIADGYLTTTPVGGTAAPLLLDLRQYTVATLAAYVAMRPGYSVAYVDSTSLVNLGAAVLLDGSGDIMQSNGDHLYGYTSVLWSYMEANSVELEAAGTQIEQMLLQMSTTTAGDMWLDELGSYYKVPREQGEADAQYGPRIIAQVLRPLANNVAIENALRVINGGLPATCDDYDTIVNGSYGLFDVDLEVSLDLLASTVYASLMLSVVDTITRMRDAGTFLRRLAIITAVRGDYYCGVAVISGETVVVVPELTPALLMDFTSEGRSYPGLTCVRSGTATRRNASGVIVAVASDTIRIDKDPSTGKLGLLVEEARTNLLVWARDFSNAVWNKSLIAVSSGSVTAPDGSTTSPKLTKSSGVAYIDQPFTFSATAYSATVVAHAAAAGGYFSIEFQPSYPNRVGATFNLTTGVVVGSAAPGGSVSSVISTSMVALGGGWYECRFSANVAAGSGALYCGPTENNGSFPDPWSGAVLAEAFVWHAQLELGAFGTSVMENGNGSTVARSADVVTQTLGSWFITSEGTVATEVNFGAATGQFQDAYSINDATSNNFIRTFRNTTSLVRSSVQAGGASQSNIGLLTVSTSAQTKISHAFRLNDFSSAQDGTLGAQDTNGTIPVVTKISIGGTVGGEFLNGHINRFEYYGRRLTNAQLQTLST